MSQLLYDLLETPEQFFTHVKRTTASIGAIVMYGHRAPTYETPFGNVSTFQLS
jgi:hypothetical protein